MKEDFESRLTALAGENNFKAAKLLLKQNGTLRGVWRDRQGRLNGLWNENSTYYETNIITGVTPTAICSCDKESTNICRHAAALLMYSGRFHTQPQPQDEIPYYRSGLVRKTFDELLNSARPPKHKLLINIQNARPHVPTQWEEIIIKVTIQNEGKKEFSGNLNNLRKLCYEKTLVQMKFDDFALQERQIIRFLAESTQAVGANLQMDSATTAEFFHTLIGYDRVFYNFHRLTIRPERLEPVLIETQQGLRPGLSFGDCIFPADNCRIISGHAGAWIGRSNEYFFMSGKYELTFIRSFLRAETDGAIRAKLPDNYQLRIIHAAQPIHDQHCQLHQILLNGLLNKNELSLKITFIYNVDDKYICVTPRSGSILQASGTQLRDIKSEERLLNALELFGFSKIEEDFCLSGIDAIAAFLHRLLPELMHTSLPIALNNQLALVFCSEHDSNEVTFHWEVVESNPAYFKLKLSFYCHEKEISWHEILSSAHCDAPFVTGSNGLPVRFSEKIRQFCRALAPILQLTEDNNFLLANYHASFFNQLLNNLYGNNAQNLPIIPASVFNNKTAGIFSGKLRDYQQEGVDFLQFMTDRNLNPILADEMGLGKTVQLLAFLASRQFYNSAPSLLIVPASLVTNWAREAAKFVPDWNIAAPENGKKRNDILRNPNKYQVIIISYNAAVLSRDIIRNTTWNYLILDEAQHIKNPGTGYTKNCKDIPAIHKIVLSGTPLENSMEDLWSVMDFLHPGMLGTLPEFRNRFINAERQDEAREQLAGLTSPFIKRRTKQMVAKDIPNKTENIIFCEFSPEQRALYNEILSEGRTELAKCAENAKTSTTIFTILLRLRQVCCHPAMLPDKRGIGIASAKTELLNELLHENIDSSHRMLLFSQFTSLLEILKEDLDKQKINYEYLDGSTRNRQERVDNFNDNTAIPLFLLSLKAGGTGLNLIGADTAIIYDPWWNPAGEAQAADRTHRIGQTKPVSILRLIVKDSIEERIIALQEKKKKLFDDLINQPTARGCLTLAELSELLE